MSIEDILWRFEEERAATASRVEQAIVLARLKAIGSSSKGLPLEAIEEAVGKELARKGYPSRLGRFAVECRVSVLPDGNFEIVRGAWCAVDESASPPSGHVLTCHPALERQDTASTLAEALILVADLRSALTSGDAEAAAEIAWCLSKAVDKINGLWVMLDAHRGKASREGGRTGRKDRTPDPEIAAKLQRRHDLAAKFRAQYPRKNASGIASKIAEVTGEKVDTVRKWLGKENRKG